MSWTPCGEAEVDKRRRMSLGKAGSTDHTRYRVSTNEDGDILLQPVVSVLAKSVKAWPRGETK